MTDLKALIERVESGSGADRELHADIIEATGGCAHRLTHREECDNDGYELVCSECGTGDLWLGMNPTSSLDAVLSLIEAKLPKWEWQANSRKRNGSKCLAWLHTGSQHDKLHKGIASDPVRALCAAALRAIQETRRHD